MQLSCKRNLTHGVRSVAAAVECCKCRRPLSNGGLECKGQQSGEKKQRRSLHFNFRVHLVSNVARQASPQGFCLVLCNGNGVPIYSVQIIRACVLRANDYKLD